MARLILVRHPPVAKAWEGRCYGQSDMGLSRAGLNMIPSLCAQLAILRPDHIVHSGLRRTRILADRLGAQLGIVPETALEWRERHFGDWEGQTWQFIFRTTGNAMDGMIDNPSGFRPGTDGETTHELLERIENALCRLPQTGRIAIISHGGPIAAARQLLTGGTISGLASKIIAPATFITLELPPSRGKPCASALDN